MDSVRGRFHFWAVTQVGLRTRDVAGDQRGEITETLTPYAVEDVILTIRGHKVILDRDLAMLYGVEVKRLNEQVKRNRDRFPDDFAFRFTPLEVTNSKPQFATSSSPGMRSQSATLKRVMG